jgi:AcrR family transcriptional regulator
MVIPDQVTVLSEAPGGDDLVWSQFTPEEKRARVLAVADDLFAVHGVEFPMPELAKAVGVGVGTLYRQFGKKEDVIAALVMQRVDFIQQHLEEAATDPDARAAFQRGVLLVVDACTNDRVMQEAWGIDPERLDLSEGRARVRQAIGDLVDRALEQNVIRADATRMDLSVLFKSVRAAEEYEPGGARRLAELVLAGLRPQPDAS